MSSIFRSASIARVIGVIDVRRGQAVHARGGKREEYQPIGDAVELARMYVDRHGVSELYVADLDAISDRDPERVALRTAVRRATLSGSPARTISEIAPTWLDEAITSVDRAREAVDLGAARVVVGLETLTSFTALRQICDAAGRDRVAFSLDLRDGVPLGIGHDDTAEDLAARAAAAGADAIIVLDLARVGMRTGLDLDLLARVRAAAPDVELVAGGGVRDIEDLARLADAGCSAALVGTALRDGSLMAALKGPPYNARR